MARQSSSRITFDGQTETAVQPAVRLQSAALLEKWPRDYTAFRRDGADVVFFAAWKPELHIEGAV
jgi:hypothetical protein